MSGAGYFGKAPSHGDFLSLGLDARFIDAWDDWLSQGIGQSRERLGADWLEVYLTSPVWCFALGAGVCGPSAMAGLFLPSVDAAGRYFPFTIAAGLAPATPPLSLRAAAGWYREAEALARSILEDRFDLDALNLKLAAMAPPAGRPAGPGAADRRYAAGDPMTAPALIHAIATGMALDYGLFWTEGSAKVPASVLLCRRLPAGERFAALLDGRFAPAGWRDGSG